MTKRGSRAEGSPGPRQRWSRRRHEGEDLARRFSELPPERARSIMLVLAGNAFVTTAVQVVLVVACLRAARRLLRERRGVGRSRTSDALGRPLVALTLAHVVHLVLTATLLARWTRRAVHRAGRDTASADPTRG